MTEAEAQLVAAKLAAAFPRDWAFVGEATNAVYVEKLRAFDRPQAAAAAVDSLIETETRLPPIATIRDEYRRLWDRYSPPALPEPEVTEDERGENIRRMRILTEHLAGAPGHAGGFDSCEHPGCSELRDLSVPGAGQD